MKTAKLTARYEKPNVVVRIVDQWNETISTKLFDVSPDALYAFDSLKEYEKHIHSEIKKWGKEFNVRFTKENIENINITFYIHVSPKMEK